MATTVRSIDAADPDVYAVLTSGDNATDQGPLPVFGALEAFTLSRRLRTRIKAASVSRTHL